MISKFREEWEKLSQEEQAAAAEHDEGRRQEILARMESIRAALNKMSQSSVTRTTLSQAVRQALEDILPKEPIVTSLRDELAAVQKRIQADPSDVARAVVARELGIAEARHAEELRALKKTFEAELSDLKLAFSEALDETTARASPVSGVSERMGAIEAGVSERFQALSSDFEQKLEALTARLRSEISGKMEEHSSRQSALAQDLATADDHLAAGLKDLECRLAARLNDVEAAAASRMEALEGNIRQSVAAAETRLGESQGQLEARIAGLLEEQGVTVVAGVAARVGKLEEAIPDLQEMEGRLQAKMGIAMDQLAEKMDSLVDMIAQIREETASRPLVEGLGQRLEHLESSFRTVSDQLDGLQAAGPELKSVGERLGDLRSEVSGLSGNVTTSEKELQEAWTGFSRKVQEIQDLLRMAIERWNVDHSNLRQRLVDLRDTLQDQLQAAAQSADGKSTFWGKLRAKPDGGLRMGGEAWERFRTRLETVVHGLEALITDTK